MNRVDFLCIGAAKSGTTWLYSNLLSHPELNLSRVKEIHYFNKYSPENPELLNPNYNKSLDWYHSFFENKTNHLKGDFSTSYLKYAECARDILNYNPQMKFIVLLRKPMDRAYSHYKFLIQRGMLSPNLSFDEAVKRNKNIISGSLYYKQLFPYFELFKKDQFKIILYEQLMEYPDLILNDTLLFLEVSPMKFPLADLIINPTLEIRNKQFNKNLISLKEKMKSGLFSKQVIKIMKHLKFNNVLNYLFILNSSDKPASTKEISAQTLNELNLLFKDDITSLEKQLNMDLTCWKN